MDILIGADPEFFVREKKTGNLVSAYGLIEGTKKNPMPMGPGHAQVDGMALEINVPPARSAKEFKDGFNGVMDALKKELPNFDFDFSPVAKFGADVIKNQPREARELGCEPDFDAWTGGKPNPKPNAETPFRTASGHVHIGWTEEQEIGDPDHIEACNMLAKQLDFFLGLPSLVWDEDVTRRELYGKAGCYRPKSYGMEYRTLSNVWLKSNETIDYVVNQSKYAFEQLVAQSNYGKTPALRGLINEGDWQKAHGTLVRYIPLPDWYNKLYKQRFKDWKAAQAILNKADIDKNAGKGDVNGVGFPANHLARVAWGKRKIVAEKVEAADVLLEQMRELAGNMEIVAPRPIPAVEWKVNWQVGQAGGQRINRFGEIPLSFGNAPVPPPFPGNPVVPAPIAIIDDFEDDNGPEVVDWDFEKEEEDF